MEIRFEYEAGNLRESQVHLELILKSNGTHQRSKKFGTAGLYVVGKDKVVYQFNGISQGYASWTYTGSRENFLRNDMKPACVLGKDKTKIIWVKSAEGDYFGKTALDLFDLEVSRFDTALQVGPVKKIWKGFIRFYDKMDVLATGL